MMFFCVFCFKQKTAYEMRINYWSSDVCSSDLIPQVAVGQRRVAAEETIGFGVLIDLRDEFAELRPRSRLRPVEAKLHVGRHFPCHGQCGEPIVVVAIGRDDGRSARLEGVDREDRLLRGFVASVGMDVDPRGHTCRGLTLVAGTSVKRCLGKELRMNV